MPQRKRNKKKKNKTSKTSSCELAKSPETQYNLGKSRSNILQNYREIKSEPDNVRTNTLIGPLSCLSSDVLSTKHVSSGVQNVLTLNKDLFDQKQENESKKQIHKESAKHEYIMTTQETRADNRTLLNAIETGEHCLAIELLKEGHTFSQDELGNALIAACQHGRKYLVQKLVHHGANVQYKDTNGNTPLLISAGNGFIDIVCFLMKKADVNACDLKGNTALILSIRSSGSKEIVKVLLTHKEININHQNKDGYTALMKALEVMDFDTVKILLDKYAEHNKCSGKFYSMHINWGLLDLIVNCKGETAQQIAKNNGLEHIWKCFKEYQGERRLPLISAYYACDTESFNILLDSQFLEINDMKSSVAETFHAIVRNAVMNMQIINDNEIAMIMRLIEYGTEVNLSLHDDISDLLCAAVTFVKCNFVELLCKHLDRQKLQQPQRMYIQTLALTEAAKIGSCDLIELLLRYGKYIETSRFSNSPLDCALSNGHIECAKFLIKHGAKIDIKHALDSAVGKQVIKYIDFLFENYRQDICIYLSENSSHQNELLISAAVNGNLEIIGHILDAGADVNGSDYSGQTPLMKSKDANVALYLISRGANVNLVTSTGNTALLSVMMDSLRYDSKFGLIQVLIENGSSVNTRNSDGETPLMLAASNNKYKRKSILRTLLNYGANLDDQDNDGDTALIHAVRCSYLQNTPILLQSAKNKDFLNVQNQKGLSALMYAVTSSDLKIVQELIDHGADVNIKDVTGNTALLHAITEYTEGMEEIMTALIKAGSHVNCQNNDGLSPLMLAVIRCLTCPTLILLDSGADVNAVSMKDNTKTAISFLTDDTERYISRDQIFCMETLLERGASSSYIKSDFLHNMIFKKETTFISKLIQYGLAPVDIKPNRMMIGDAGIISTVSPLCAALLVGNVSLARYFFENLYLTNSDISSLTGNKDIQHILEQKKQEESVKFLNEISSQPFSLFQLSFVSVSSAVGPSAERENRVNLLPLPQVIKDKLLFKSEVVTLNIPSESNVKTSTSSEMDLRIQTYRFLADHDVEYCDIDNIYSANWYDSDYYDYDTD